MRRTIKELTSFVSIKHLIYIPYIVLKIRNWHTFLLNYIGLKNTGELYVFRDGTKILTKEGCESGNIAVIFIKTDYGAVKDNSVIIDIGANNGVYSVYSAVKSKNTIVYSYEPVPATYETLVENINLNKLKKNIIPFNLGIASKKEKRKLFCGGGSLYNSLIFKKAKFLDIHCISLKDVFELNGLKNCDILKIDCEGAEFEILYNTPKACFSMIKEIRMEYHNIGYNQDYNIDTLTNFLISRGYLLIKLREVTLREGIAWFKKT
jgi:FkbM family methyltransferase